MHTQRERELISKALDVYYTYYYHLFLYLPVCLRIYPEASHSSFMCPLLPTWGERERERVHITHHVHVHNYYVWWYGLIINCLIIIQMRAIILCALLNDLAMPPQPISWTLSSLKWSRGTTLHVSSIPSFPFPLLFPSLNLSPTCMLYTYEL